jgi:signal transduction histidine kinase
MTMQEIDSVAKTLPKAKDDTNKVLKLIDLCIDAGYYDLNKSREFARQGVAVSEKINYTLGKGRTIYLWGTCETDMSNYTRADSLLRVAERILTSINAKKYVAMVHNGWGAWHYMQGNYHGAAESYTKTANLFDELKDTVKSLIAYQNLVSVLAELRNFEKAVALCRKVLAIAELRKDTLQMGYTLQGLITDLIYMDSLKQAEAYMPKFKYIVETTKDMNLATESYSTIATLYFHKKEYPKAIEYFQKALDIGIAMNSNYQVTNHMKSLGAAYLVSKNYPLARKTLDEAHELAKKYNNRRAVFGILLEKAYYYDSVRDYKNAYRSLSEYVNMKDSIMNTETRKHASSIETLYETAKKEKEIERLLLVEQEKNFAIRQRNTWIIIGAALLVALGIIFFLVYNNYRNKQKLAAQQAALQEEKIVSMEKEQQVASLQAMINGQETERTRIARDLHDGLGGILSTVKMHFSTLQHEVSDLRGNQLYKKSFDLVDTASEELRKIAHNMMPEVLMKMGLVPALQDFCNNVNAGRLLHISLQEYGMEKRLGSSTEIMLFRIIQELINNIIKHAYATEALIQMNREGSRLSITVEDNGRGFDMEEAETKRTMGIQTIKSRINYLNGKLSIDSRKDVGTTIMIDLLVNE